MGRPRISAPSNRPAPGPSLTAAATRSEIVRPAARASRSPLQPSWRRSRAPRAAQELAEDSIVRFKMPFSNTTSTLPNRATAPGSSKLLVCLSPMCRDTSASHILRITPPGRCLPRQWLARRLPPVLWPSCPTASPAALPTDQPTRCRFSPALTRIRLDVPNGYQIREVDEGLQARKSPLQQFVHRDAARGGLPCR